MDTKTCTQCQQVKPLEEFANSKQNKSGKAAICKACVVAKTKAWRVANPNHNRALAAAYRQKHRKARNAKALLRYYKLMEEDPESIRALRRKNAKTPKGVVANRAARHRRRGCPLSPEAKAWWLSLDDPKCHYCGEPAIEIDHLTPITRGGTGDLSNVAPACRRCNAEKGDMTYQEFLAKRSKDR